MKDRLAIQGGAPVRTRPFPAFSSLGSEEREAVLRVMDSGRLSGYLGCWDEDFLGGPEVRRLEREWAEAFGVRHAVAVNSATSGLYAAVGASGVEPGEEIIVSPYTMSASAVAPLIYNAIPVFADIEADCFCLDPASVEARLTPRTRAVIVVDLFGQPYDARALNALAEKHGLFVIEDAAQAVWARYQGRPAGTLGHLGVFSLNYHKQINCGEGGVVVTDSDELADRVRLIRNHAEAVVGDKGQADLTNLIGFNFRLTELGAAIARCQLQKVEGIVTAIQERAAYLSGRLASIPALETPRTRPGASHAFYVLCLKFDRQKAGVSRDRFVEAVRAELPFSLGREREGCLISTGYVKPLYLEPLFQQRIAYGSAGFPFTPPFYQGRVDYSPGLCPVTELMHDQVLIGCELVRPEMTEADLDDVARAFWKVWENREVLY